MTFWHGGADVGLRSGRGEVVEAFSMFEKPVTAISWHLKSYIISNNVANTLVYVWS